MSPKQAFSDTESGTAHLLHTWNLQNEPQEEKKTTIGTICDIDCQLTTVTAGNSPGTSAISPQRLLYSHNRRPPSNSWPLPFAETNADHPQHISGNQQKITKPAVAVEGEA